METLMASSFDRISLAEFGRDHWSTLAYLENIMVEYGECQVDLDPRMRTNRKHYRLLAERKHLARHVGTKWRLAQAMRPEHGSRISGGRVVTNHDDWDCVEDLIAAGLLMAKSPHNRPTLYLTPLGDRVAAALREHKRRGGTWSAFTCALPVMERPEEDGRA